MTCALGIRVPGHGAIIACDSRVSCDETGLIYTDNDRKWLEAGTCVVVMAGSANNKWSELKVKPSKNWHDLLERILDLDAVDHERDAEYIVYDRDQEQLILVDSSGDYTNVGTVATIGSGGAYARGVLDACKLPKDLISAGKLARKAVQVACKRNIFCGGKIRVVNIPFSKRQGISES